MQTRFHARGAIALLLAGAGLLGWAPVARADDHGRLDDSLRVQRVLAGDRLALGDGRVLRLAGVRVPPPDDAARAWLEGVVARGPLRLRRAETSPDRWGNLVAQAVGADGVWLQGGLLERGLAQVQTRPGEVLMAAEMLALERAARIARRGLWAESRWAPRAASALSEREHGFRIVRGRVLRVAPTRHHVYLNFGSDWWSDFTVRVRRADLAPLFEDAGLDVAALAGREVEVRGFVIQAGGPLIELSHPQQIEVLP